MSGSAPSWAASRSRTSGSTSKTATAIAPTPKKTAMPRPPVPKSRKASPRDAAALHRHPDQAAQRRAAPAKHPHARRVPDRADPRCREAARRIRRPQRVTIPEQVTWFAEVLGEAERTSSLPAGSLRFEIMIETPQIIVDRTGRPSRLWRGRRGGSARRTSAPTTTPRDATSLRPTKHGAPRLRVCPPDDAGGVRGHGVGSPTDRRPSCRYRCIVQRRAPG